MLNVILPNLCHPSIVGVGEAFVSFSVSNNFFWLTQGARKVLLSRCAMCIDSLVGVKCLGFQWETLTLGLSGDIILFMVSLLLFYPRFPWATSLTHIARLKSFVVCMRFVLFHFSSVHFYPRKKSYPSFFLSFHCNLFSCKAIIPNVNKYSVLDFIFAFLLICYRLQVVPFAMYHLSVLNVAPIAMLQPNAFVYSVKLGHKVSVSMELQRAHEGGPYTYFLHFLFVYLQK